jgi:hypothetical protein
LYVSSISLVRVTRRREVKAMQATEKDPSELGKPVEDVPAFDIATGPRLGLPTRGRKTERFSNEKKVAGSSVLLGRKGICALCSQASDEMFCGACVDKIRADAVEHKRWEEKGKP